MAIQPAQAAFSPDLGLAPSFEANDTSLGLIEGELTPALELWDIVKTWRGAGRVLDHVDLAVNPGSAIHISGRNGCGKTTLLKIAIGLIRPEAGLVSSAGLFPDLNRRRYQQRLGFLAAGDRALYARMTVRQHLRFWARIGFIPRSEEQVAIERTLVRFGLEELADRRVDRMSMGQRQRARLAGAFLHDPTVILLDEPRNSLDDEGIALLVKWTEEALGQDGAVIWCSPNAEAAELSFTDHLVLENGKLNRV